MILANFARLSPGRPPTPSPADQARLSDISELRPAVARLAADALARPRQRAGSASVI
jgi:hypothetical protein